jgi:transcriptional regulator with GAF, ATPase, and Fis domain
MRYLLVESLLRFWGRRSVDARIGERLLDTQVAGIAIFDRELRCVQVNAELGRLAHKTPAQLIGLSLDAFLEGYHTDELAAVTRVLMTGTAVYDRIVETPTLKLRVDYVPVRAEDGRPAAVIIIAVDLTAQRRAETALAERLTTSELVSELSASFIGRTPAEIDDGIGHAIQLIGERLGLDGTHIGVVSDDRATWRMSHEWIGARGQPTIHRFESVPLYHWKWSAERTFAGEPVIVPSADDLPAEAAAERELFVGLGFRAVAVFPLKTAHDVVGLVAFSRVDPYNWTPEELATLRLVAEILANALERKRNDSALSDRLAFEEALSKIATRFISASVDAIDGAIEDALRVVGEALRYERTGVFLLDDKREHMALQFEWCAPGVTSFRASMSGMPIKQFGWPLNQIAAGRTVNIDRRALPPDAEAARRVLDRDGFTTLSTVPMCIEEQVVGCVGLHSRGGRTLDDTMVARIRLVGDIISGAIARKRAELARRAAFAEVEKLKNRAERERDYLREEAGARRIVGDSEELTRLLETIDVVASTGATVLIRGESGVGKELFARAIHERSRRSAGPLVKVNCASVPKELFESEFFGHVRGAFTGAIKDRVGRFELADGGTLFLDEVGDIPLDLQAKLLRVLQESELERVGDDRTRKVDVRIVAATNRNLEADVLSGQFRQDLYYRLSVFPVEVPPLRARKRDIVPLAEHFLRASSAKLGRAELAFDESQRRMLAAYDWPGNVRELQHVIERAVILSAAPPLQLERALAVSGAVAATPVAVAPSLPSIPAFPSLPSVALPSGARSILTESDLRNLERDSIVAALERAAGRIAGPGGAAELLGVRPSTLRDRMKALGIQRPAS